MYLRGMEDGFSMQGMSALQWAREISRIPDGHFTVAFFPYSRSKGTASAQLVVKEGCKYRKQLPDERFQATPDNYFLFTDGNGEPRMCWRILIRYMGFPQDGYRLHKIDWL